MVSFRVLVAYLVVASVVLLDATSAQPWGDFEAIVQSYARKLGETLNREVLWADPYRRNPHMQNNAQYEQYQASIRVVGDVKYGSPVSDISRPAWTFNQWFHNSMSTPIKSMFHKVKAEADEFEWSVNGNLVFAKDKVKKNFTFMIPPQLGLDRKNYTKEFKADEIMYGFQSKHSVTKMDLFNISQEIVVPANRSVQSTLVITERDVTIPWEMDLAISGSFAVWFKKKWNGHWLWFFPVHNLERENKNFRRVGDKLLYTLKGSFTGVFGTSAHLYLKEFEYRKPGFMANSDAHR